MRYENSHKLLISFFNVSNCFLSIKTGLLLSENKTSQGGNKSGRMEKINAG
jgi:hypothetical protein